MKTGRKSKNLHTDWWAPQHSQNPVSQVCSLQTTDRKILLGEIHPMKRRLKHPDLSRPSEVAQVHYLTVKPHSYTNHTNQAVKDTSQRKNSGHPQKGPKYSAESWLACRCLKRLEEAVSSTHTRLGIVSTVKREKLVIDGFCLEYSKPYLQYWEILSPRLNMALAPPQKQDPKGLCCFQIVAS